MTLDISYANLKRANLSRTNLSRAYLSEANLREANLRGANLRATDLQDIQWNQDTNWEGVQGLDTAKNVPEALKQQLGL
ncbi:MAG: pentapeptide repeat-containing protein [Cyanobacteria bacterium P01_A01_bin.37]